jgi:hypothetical protein
VVSKYGVNDSALSANAPNNWPSNAVKANVNRAAKLTP